MAKKDKPIVNRDKEARVERFIEFYLVSFNGADAAIKAGYSKNRANQTAYDLLQEPDVQKRLSERKSQAAQKVGVTPEIVLEELRRIATADIRSVFNKDNSLKNIHDFDDDTAPAINSIEADELYSGGESIGKTKKVRMHDKIKALDMLGKYFKMWDGEGDRNANINITIGYGKEEE